MKNTLTNHRKVVSLSLVSVVLFIFISCQKNDDADRIHVTPQERPTVSSIDPTSATVGTEILITGTNFREKKEQNKVFFNGSEGNVISANTTTLLVEVPSAATTGNVRVEVLNFGVDGPVFTVEAPAPIITSFEPASGVVNTVVTIYGENFGLTPEENIVTIGGAVVPVIEASFNTLKINVTDEAISGPISVTVKNKKVNTTSEFTVVKISTIVIPLASEEDDAEEVVIPDTSGSGVVGQMDISSSDLELGEISSGDGLQDVGVRFIDVQVPHGATVTEAFIQFNCDNDGSDPVEMTIYGENVANAATYTSDPFNITSRPLTTASVVWNIPEWVNAGDRGPAQQTVNLAPIIQEIINRDDWVQGNSINFIFKNTGVSANASSSSGGREAENYSSSKPEDGAELTITFQ